MWLSIQNDSTKIPNSSLFLCYFTNNRILQISCKTKKNKSQENQNKKITFFFKNVP